MPKKSKSDQISDKNLESREEGGEKQKALKIALEALEKQYGKGAIMQIKDSEKVAVSVIPTGSLSLDIALGVGGLPRGRVVEIFGPEMSGKSTLALHVIREAQKKGGLCALID